MLVLLKSTINKTSDATTYAVYKEAAKQKKKGKGNEKKINETYRMS